MTLTVGQGAYAIKLAQASNIHPIIAIAGRGESFVETLINREKGDSIVDYRQGDDELIAGIRNALKNAGVSEVRHAFDAVSEKNSFQNLSKVLAPHGSKITLVLPGKDYSEIPQNIEKSTTTVGSVHRTIGQNRERVLLASSFAERTSDMSTSGSSQEVSRKDGSQLTHMR